MRSLGKTLFTLLAFLIISAGAVDVARAQSTALNGLIAFTSTNPPGQAQAVAQSPTATWQFGYQNMVPFTLYNRQDTPQGNDPFGTGGARLYPSLAAGATVPSVFYTNESALGVPGPFTNPLPPPTSYLLVSPGAGVPPNDPAFANSVVRYYTATASTVTFTGFFQTDVAVPGANQISVYVNGVLTPVSGIGPLTPILATVSNFSFTLALVAGSTVNFVFSGIPTQRLRFNVTAIPEPTMLLLLGISALGIGGRVFRRRKSVEDEADVDEACAT
jgi:PEP-CTERM motif